MGSQQWCVCVWGGGGGQGTVCHYRQLGEYDKTSAVLREENLNKVAKSFAGMEKV